MFEDPLCSLSKSLGIHGVNVALPRRREHVCADVLASARTRAFTPGNFIMDATMRPSHGRPSSHRLTICPSVCPSAIVHVTTLSCRLPLPRSPSACVMPITDLNPNRFRLSGQRIMWLGKPKMVWQRCSLSLSCDKMR
jgi:hypothetical protein